MPEHLYKNAQMMSMILKAEFCFFTLYQLEIC